MVVTESDEFDVNSPIYDGTIVSAQGIYTIVLKFDFSDADNLFQKGDTYRVYNESPSHINVKDSTTGDAVTNIPAWTFKDFYYDGLSWGLAKIYLWNNLCKIYLGKI